MADIRRPRDTVKAAVLSLVSLIKLVVWKPLVDPGKDVNNPRFLHLHLHEVISNLNVEGSAY